ncbi:MarR family transcriptional regulator [Jiella sp. MQZ9-1]|uniref:MarR family transcriptional regulator n=1 Tax=Jiella flava TaxID=2816857 RepID=A0A939FWY0_9HYPH|nr:MarR family transcriptional regulator [Jiella flava]MBO0661022.1 MarR family transcriptional regulator [Jiella flava]MCD2469670.1 MarR family transcriptional regulator [Jiella flava]
MNTNQSLQFDLTTNLVRVGRVWRRHVRNLVEAHGISEACAHPLITIGRMGDGVRQGTVADEVGMEGPSLVRLLDQLCESGVVERREDPSDRRAKTLWLTKNGRALMESIEADLVALRTRVLKDVPRADIEATLRVIAVLDAYQPEVDAGDASESPKERP